MIYLDHSATTKPDSAVLQTFIQANERYYANPASLHQLGTEANTLLMKAREQIAQILNTESEHIIFTSGGTESNNFAVKGLARANQHRGKHILISAIEHPSVIESAHHLTNEGFELEFIDVDDHGRIKLADLQRKIRKDTVLVSIMHVNNEMGAIQPITDITQIVRANSRAFFHVDAVQSFGKIPVQFQGDVGPDAMTISGHKINGLKGTGLLAFSKRIKIQPIMHGGGQELGYRSGTVAVPQNVSLAKAMRLAAEHMSENTDKFVQWRNDLHAFFNKFYHVHVISNNDGAPHIVSCSVRGLKGEVIVNALQSEGFIVSTSSACSSKNSDISHVVEALYIEESFQKGVIRISLGNGLTNSNIDQFKIVFAKMMKQLKGETIQL
ncbi:cysteine desulfurase [Viridibacillus sp. YIM B01967]|uniref:Cysteine desulfurase n=1 Tax=Viridibacillus soli TaxID=2798301 RepID=A0ABS1H2F6_9BACL|nr:cysteine desulfurase family protein [Viridibacillus soli]MBK3493598.1 cysteine desulfurase [Viridibacillus soli]